MRILLVEDEPLLAMSLMNDLEEAGHVVLGPADTIAAALTSIKHSTPELAILNIDLKHGDSGIELARMLLRQFNCPSLFVTGSHVEAREAKHLALGFINKPYRSSVIVQRIEVAKHIIAGEKLGTVPRELELFGTSAAALQTGEM